ncbi:MAG: 4-hydroxy-tetrahydrodipicolinate synthase [Muribaculaceae bacterium]|nr:4-hydroxy-tetrahydrodipicolinate synthase [Muribaculaceae bacterium]
MKHNHLAGTGVALITPFNDDLSIDFNALENIVEHVISGGADFLVVLGTTGETALLSYDEKQSVIAFVKEKAAGRVPLVLGYGGISTAELVDGFKYYDFDGIDAILTVTPFYVKPTQKGLQAHYKAVADASPRPVILYNVPGRTGINMDADTTVALSAHPNIIGIKEASGKLFQTEEILLRKPDDFLLYSGEDALTFHLMNLGSDGVISVVANAFPAEVSTIVDKGASQEAFFKARDAHFSLKILTKAVFADGNPCGIKYVLSKLGLCKNIVRLPLVPISEETAAVIDRELKLR